MYQQSLDMLYYRYFIIYEEQKDNHYSAVFSNIELNTTTKFNDNLKYLFIRYASIYYKKYLGLKEVNGYITNKYFLNELYGKYNYISFKNTNSFIDAINDSNPDLLLEYSNDIGNNYKCYCDINHNIYKFNGFNDTGLLLYTDNDDLINMTNGIINEVSTDIFGCITKVNTLLY